MNLGLFLNIAIVVLSIAVIAIVLVQGQTSSGLGSVFGGTDIYRTRRGMEKTLFNATFLLAGLLLVLCLVTVMLQDRI